MDENPYESPGSAKSAATSTSVGAARAEPTTIELSIAGAAFPLRCVHCGGRPEETIGVECKSGIDLIFVSFNRWHVFELPVCSPCKSRRRNLGIAIHAIAFAVVLALCVAMIAAEPLFVANDQRDLWLILLLGVVLAGPYWIRNRLSPRLDWWLLGVRGLRLSRTGLARLRFKNRAFANESVALTQHLLAGGAPASAPANVANNP